MKILTDRKDIAQALNFGKHPVLTFNLDTGKGSKARVTKESSRFGTMLYRCNLNKDYNVRGDGILYLATRASMIKREYLVGDTLEDALYASSPIIEPNAEVAVLFYSLENDIRFVRIVKSGKVDPSYSSATIFSEVE